MRQIIAFVSGAYRRDESVVSGSPIWTSARSLLLGSASAAIIATAAQSQDATWTGAVSGDWQTPGNWTPATQPTGIAIFGASTQTTITFSNNDVFHQLSVGTIQLDAGSPTYTFGPDYLAFTGLGIVNNSSNAPIFAPFSNLTFLNSSTAANAILSPWAWSGSFTPIAFRDNSNAGSATITQTGATYFYGNSSAANATINTSLLYVSNGGFTWFNDGSSAGSATLNNSNGGRTMFDNSSTAASALITNDGVYSSGLYHTQTSTQFGGSSSAGSAIIKNLAGGRTDFIQNSAAAAATITNSGRDAATGWNSSTAFTGNTTANSAVISNDHFGYTYFSDASSAAQAIVTNASGGATFFSGTATAADARITNNDGGTTIFSGASNPANARLINNLGGTFIFATTAATTVASIEGAGTFYIQTPRLSAGTNNLSTEVSGSIAGFGSLEKVGSGVLTLSGMNSYAGTVISAGTLQIGNGGTTGSIHGDVVNNAQLTINRSDTVMFDSAVSGSGAFKQAGTGTTILTGASTYGGGTTIAAGTLQLGYGASTGWIVGDVNNNGTFAINRFDAVTFGGQISGSGAFKQLGYGSTTLSGANSYSGGTTIDAGTLLLAGAGTLGSVTGVTVINRWGALDLGGTAQAQSAVTLNAGVLQNGSLSGAIVSTGGTIRDIGGNTSLAASGGLTSLAGMNTYTGATNVTGGILAVDGVVAGTSAVNVMSGGVLSGSGTINSPTVTVGSGGIFAPGSGVPGSSANVVGSLAFEVGARYLVQINPSTASYANVTGLASLGGASVNAVFAPGAYVQKKYTILAASNGITGAFAPSVVNTDLPVNFRTDLSYDATHAYLDLTLTLASPSGGGLSENQRSVGNAIIGFFDRAGGIPMIFGALNGRGLTQVSGESGTSTQQTSFNAMNQFMGILSDPFSARGQGGEASSGGASGFAEETTSAYAAARDARTDAFAMFTKAPTGAPAERRWSVWAAGFGGSQSTDGSAAAGSSDTTSRIYGTAVGADYRILPGTTVGFALAGGGTSYSVSGLGSGRSDLFQGGGYVRQVLGQAYVQAALAYGWQDVTTNRTLTVGGIDQLQARFNTNTYSGRIEAGYRLLTPALGGMVFTPYAAGQFTALDLPAYAENVVAGASTFALAYGARNVTDTRSEVGFRTEKYVAVSNGIVGLRARVAWAHDFNTDRSVAATFQALPGASFVVSGARQAADAALTTASAEMNWMNGWSVAATFEGEFSNVTRSYAGKGGVKYQW